MCRSEGLGLINSLSLLRPALSGNAIKWPHALFLSGALAGLILILLQKFSGCSGSVRAEKIQASSLEKKLLETVAAIVLPTSKNRPIEGSWCSLFVLPDPEFLFLRVARGWENMLLSGRLFPDLQEFDELMVWLLKIKSNKTWLSRFMANIFLVSSFDCWVLLFFSAVVNRKYLNCGLLHIKSAKSEIKLV